MSTTRSIIGRSLPVLVSVGVLSFILTRVDLAGAVSKLDAQAASVLIPALLAYGAVSLCFEAICLRVAVPPTPGFDLATAARIKSASYLLNLVHYAAGAGVLALLVRRRAGIGLADAMGVVMLIVLLDVGVLIVLTAIGVTWIGSERPLVQGSVLVGAGALIAIGLGVLRAPRSLGPLDGVRNLEVFRAARTAPAAMLAQLSALRTAFVCSFIALVWAALSAFEVHLPLGDVILGVAAISLVAALPIAVAGLGTGQAAFMYVFQAGGDKETLLACSLALSAGLIVLRALIGVLFAREFTREAFAAARQEEA